MTSTGGPFSNAGAEFSPAREVAGLVDLGSALILGIEALVMAVGGHNRQPAWSWFEVLGLTRDELVVRQNLADDHLRLPARKLVACGRERAVSAAGRIENRAHGRAGSLGESGYFSGCWAVRSGILVLAPGGEDAPLLVGLSGGCMGLLLLLTTLSPQSRMMPLPVSGKSLGLGILMAELVLALADPALGVPGFSDSRPMAHPPRLGQLVPNGPCLPLRRRHGGLDVRALVVASPR